MRVGVNSLYLIPREVGGSETILRETLDAIVQYFPAIQLHIFTNDENDQVLRHQFANFKQVQFSSLRFKARNRVFRIIREQIQLPFYVKKAEIDILWSPGYTAPVYAPCPQVVSILDMQYKKHPEDLGFVARLVTHCLIWLSSRWCRAILALSEFSKREVVKYLDVAKNKVFVSYCGVHGDFFRRQSEFERNQILGRILAIKRPYLLCVANSYPHKNLPILANAFEKLLNEIPHQLVLLGQAGRGEGELEKAIRRIPKDRVVRLAHYYKPELISIYQAADLFILPSSYEGFGLPVLEAMMAGIPVVTTRCASIPEIGGDCVLYFDDKSDADLADVIRKALGMSGEKRQEWISQAQTRAQEFTWKRAAEVVVKCLQSVLT